MQIHRLQPIDPPLPKNEILRTLSRVPSDPYKEPVFDEEMLASMMEDTNPPQIDAMAADHIRMEWDKFLKEVYTQWRESEIPRRKTIQVASVAQIRLLISSVRRRSLMSHIVEARFCI